MARGKELGGPAVHHDGAVGLQAADLGEVEQGSALVVVEQFPLATVRVGGEGEVERCHRLALGDGLDELVLGHRLDGVVGPPLLADR